MVDEYDNSQEVFKFLQKNKEAYPNLSVLLKVALTIPVTSVNCERGISRYAAIKTDTRNKLKVKSVEQLMTLSIEAVSYKKFKYDKAFEEWCQLKDRRQYKIMTKDGEKQSGKVRDASVAADSLTDLPMDLSFGK